MNVVVAKNAGFCFGVRRATETLERAISEGVGKIYTYGDVIHNRQYLDKLASLGVKSISGAEIDAIAADSTASSPSTVVIRAHGIERDEEMKLHGIEASNPYFHVLDCTCPFVSKVHRIAEKETGEDTVFFLIGSASHPEVKGIMSWAVGEKHVFLNADSLESFIISQNDEKLSAKCVVLAAQTTQKLSEWKKCQKIVQTHYTNRKIFDTICSVTEDRQREAASLAPTVDAMLVIGGADSSNTNKLCDVCREACPRTYRIETADDIPTEIIGTLYKIGITAGASTPDGIIEEVKTKMADIETNKSFEELIDESLKTINSGDIVTGTVTSVSGTEVHLDIGGKTTGIITADQFSDDPSAKLSDLVKVGDEVKAFVIKNSDIDGIAMLSKRRVDSDACWFAMEENAKNGAIIEAKTTVEMAKRDIAPAVASYVKDLADTVVSKKQIGGITTEFEEGLINHLSELELKLSKAVAALEDDIKKAAEMPEGQEQAEFFADVILPKMNDVRAVADEMEENTAESYWPFPTYGDLLFSIQE